MPVNEEGVYEVLLSGRQLIGILTIVLLLITTAFWMGHVTAKPPLMVAKTSAAPPETQTPPPPPPPAAAHAEPAPLPATPEEAARHAEVERKQTTEEAGEKTGSPRANRPEPPAEPPAGKPAQKQDAPEEAGAIRGTYLQLAAGGRTEIHSMSRKLSGRSFHAVSVPGAKQGVYRLLVGPFEGAEAIAEARERLTKSGFNGKNAIVKKF